MQPQSPPKPLELTDEQLSRIERSKRRDQSLKVGPEEAFVAEFGYYYGWAGVEAILDNQISMEVASTLLAGAQKVWYNKLIDQSYITYTAMAAAKSGKKGKQVMKKGLKEYMKQAKVEA